MSVPEGFVELAPEAIQDAGRLPLFVRVALVSREELMLWAGDTRRKLSTYPRVLLYGGPTTAARVPELERIVDNWTRLVLTQTGQLWTPVWDEPARILPNGLMGYRWPFAEFRWVTTWEYGKPERHRIVYRTPTHAELERVA